MDLHVSVPMDTHCGVHVEEHGQEFASICWREKERRRRIDVIRVVVIEGRVVGSEGIAETGTITNSIELVVIRNLESDAFQRTDRL